MATDFTVSDLRKQPKFFDTVAERIWRAWWRSKGHSLDRFSDGLRKLLNDDAIPFGLVAHAGEQYLGSTLGIMCDLDERPQYSPWVAAVWVEPEHRLNKVGRTLVGHTMQAFFDIGFQRIYLCSSPKRRNFYTRQGWVPIEEDVGPDVQTVYACDTSAPEISKTMRHSD
jgi:GNAT superfamily N-acetyltransferase